MILLLILYYVQPLTFLSVVGVNLSLKSEFFFEQVACEVESTSPSQDRETRKWEGLTPCNHSAFESQKASHINKDILDEVFF